MFCKDRHLYLLHKLCANQYIQRELQNRFRLRSSDFGLRSSVFGLRTPVFGLLFYLLLTAYTFPTLAQNNLEYPGTEEGIAFKSADSSMHINFGARMQNRMEFNRYKGDIYSDKMQFQVRRMRLKADGFMVDPRLRFKLELAFSGEDVDAHPQGEANLLLDASIQYAFTPDISLSFGQFKVPGNRQRVISSQDLQMVDRSVVNSAYNLDRDVGLMLEYVLKIGQAQFKYLSAITNGEGRNLLSSAGDINRNNSLDLAFTQRLEFLPFGDFQEDGDYFESDLLLEPNPKISFGAGYSHNENAIRQRGQRGNFLHEPRDVYTIFSDLIFKYRGWSVMAEYMHMDSKDPVTELEGDFRIVEAGKGYMVQAGKVLPSFWEISARYAKILPDHEVKEFQQEGKEVLLGISRYIRGHRIKVQSDVGYVVDKNLSKDLQKYWQWRFQVELGF